MSDEKKRNRVRRVLAEIESNAKKATPGPWSISHSHVIKFAPDDPRPNCKAFDIACRPWEEKQTVYGVNPFGSGSDDMRYIATVDPEKMMTLIADIRELLGIEA